MSQNNSSVRRSINMMGSQQSHDSIVQELDSISRIYEDLETVQEEEAGLTYE